MNVQTLYENDDYVVVNKPYDMYINHDNKEETNTVAFHIARYDSHLSSSEQPLHFVQRLDYATSGVLCIAKNKRAAAAAGRLLETRRASKYYLAVLRGVVGYAAADIEYAIGEDPSALETNHRMLAVTDAASRRACLRPRAAQTRLMVLAEGRYGDDPVTLVLLKPTTGRRHQLRAHCGAGGRAVLGDATYAADRAPRRMFLHALRLVLPFKDETLDIKTSVPFYNDEEFRWCPSKVYFKCSNAEDILNICHEIDNIDVKDNCFRYSETR